MGMREKMVELCRTACSPANCRPGKGYDKRCYECVADHIVANGGIIPVLCKDCTFSKYFEESGTRKCRAQKGLCRTVEDDDFCSYGERRKYPIKKLNL